MRSSKVELVKKLFSSKLNESELCDELMEFIKINHVSLYHLYKNDMRYYKYFNSEVTDEEVVGNVFNFIVEAYNIVSNIKK